MRKNKKIIIIFSLILSLLFLNVTPVYCANTIVNVSIEDFSGDLSTLNVYYKYPFIKFNQYGTRVLEGKEYLSFFYDGNLSNIIDELSLYFNDEEVEIESISTTGTEIYINPIFKDEESEIIPPEEPENTETETPTPTPDEEPTTPPVDVVIDNTEVVTELKEIKSYMLMFMGLFFMYFGYKIVKEIVNKQRR